jgi:hypothetical protein
LPSQNLQRRIHVISIEEAALFVESHPAIRPFHPDLEPTTKPDLAAVFGKLAVVGRQEPSGGDGATTGPFHFVRDQPSSVSGPDYGPPYADTHAPVSKVFAKDSFQVPLRRYPPADDSALSPSEPQEPPAAFHGLFPVDRRSVVDMRGGQ